MNGHAARMGEMRNAYKLLVGKPERKRPVRRITLRLKNNIKMNLTGMWCEVVTWIKLLLV